MNYLFFELIQVALGSRTCLSHTPSADEWGELYAMAKKQSLVGVCFAGVQKLQTQRQEPPEMLYLTWMGMAAKIQQRNEVVNRQCVDLQKRLAADGFNSLIMKGQGVGTLYRVYDNDNDTLRYDNLSMLRQSGDIDVLVDAELPELLEYVNKVAPTNEVDRHHIHFDVFADTEVELHYVPINHPNPWKNKKLQRWFAETKKKGVVTRLGDGEIVTPCFEFNAVFLLMHIYHHFFNEGVGMRQLMDCYFVLRLFQEASNGFRVSSDDYKTKTIKNPEGFASACVSENLNKLDSSATQTSVDSDAVGSDPSGKKQKKHLSPVEVVSELGLNRFASALVWVIGYVFDPLMLETWSMKPETALWQPNKEDGKILLDEILRSGNFGKMGDNDILKMSVAKRIWHRFGKQVRFGRFDRTHFLWSPLFSLDKKLWQMKHGYK